MDTLANLRTALYARFSSSNQRDTSIDDQVRVCRDYLDRNGGNVDGDRILTDYAVSGTTQARAGFDALLKLVEARKVDLVVTESGDRLSRDLGDADRLWKHCEYNNVRLICVADGIDSAKDGARMAFRFKAVMSDEFIHDLRKKTLRGLQGQHSRGYSTGGLPYGYKSEAVWGANKREPDGYEIQIDNDKAAIVGRIFARYKDGHSFLSICEQLNNESVPPPRGNDAKKFWRKSTVREILNNRTYLGEFSFGKKQWRKDPTTRRRRYTKRSAADVQVDHRPQLRIIEVDLWEAAHARRKAVGNRTAPARRTHRPFSGLLFCGVCNARMVDGGGSAVRHYRCNQAHSGAACSNKAPLREDTLRAVAIAELKRLFTQTGLRERMAEMIEDRLKTFRVETSNEEARVTAELARVGKEVDRLVAFITTTDLGSSPGALNTIRDQLERATSQKREAEARLAELKSKAALPAPTLPTVDEIVALVLDIETRIDEDPIGVREDLRQMLHEGKITMIPQPDGSYIGHSHVLPLRVPRPLNRKAPVLAGASGTSVENGGCGGRIWPDSAADSEPLGLLFEFRVMPKDGRKKAA